MTNLMKEKKMLISCKVNVIDKQQRRKLIFLKFHPRIRRNTDV